MRSLTSSRLKSRRSVRYSKSTSRFSDSRDRNLSNGFLLHISLIAAAAEVRAPPGSPFIVYLTKVQYLNSPPRSSGSWKLEIDLD